jgi:hypothetical protein
MSAWIIKSETYDPDLALEIVEEQRNKGCNAWIEDENGAAVDEQSLKINGRVATESVIDERAKQIGRMVMFIVHGLQTKSYDEFIESFSNPGAKPTLSERLKQELHFQMRISPTCWYDAVVEYPLDSTPHFYVEGSGDDWGVLISGDAAADHRIGVDFIVPTGSQPGRDAHAIMHTLQKMPGWSRASDIELASFAANRQALSQ